MSSDAILFQQWLLCEVELKRIIRAQTNVKPDLEKVWEGVPFIGEKERVVT